MVGLISIIIIIVISFVMMMEGWEKYDSQKFYTGLLVIGISIIMIFPVMQYNMENMKNVCKFKKLNEMKLDDYGFGLFEYNGVLYFKEAEGERCFDVRSGNEVIIGKDKIVTLGGLIMRKLDDTNRTRKKNVRHSWVKAGRDPTLRYLRNYEAKRVERREDLALRISIIW